MLLHALIFSILIMPIPTKRRIRRLAVFLSSYMVIRSRILLLAASAAFFSSPRSPAAEVARYQFEEGSGATALDTAEAPFGGDDNGTLSGATLPSYIASPVSGAFALDFNGTTSRIELGADQDLLNGVAGATVATWMSIDTLSGGADEHIVHLSVGSDTGTNAGHTRLLLRVQDNLRLEAGGRSTDTEAFQGVTSPNFSTLGIGTNQWFHVAAVIDFSSDSIFIFVNGQPVATTGTVNFAGTTTANTVSMRSSIGSGFSSTGSPSGFFDGKLDDVRIYNTALSASEVAALVPEPSTAGLLLLGGLAFGAIRRRA